MPASHTNVFYEFLTLKGREITASRGIPDVLVVRLCPPKCLGIAAFYCSVERKFCKHTKKDYIFVCFVTWDYNMEKSL